MVPILQEIVDYLNREKVRSTYGGYGSVGAVLVALLHSPPFGSVKIDCPRSDRREPARHIVPLTPQTVTARCAHPTHRGANPKAAAPVPAGEPSLEQAPCGKIGGV